ncbi:hypothetical protein [Methylobacterium sp.]|uniref:hypothetical protein n=1 Tax=Methylobacterium sp. TaxID=409 RepID=UPI003B5B2FCA
MLIRALLVGAAVLAVTTGCGDDDSSAKSGTAGSSAQAPASETAAAAITLDVTADKTHAVQPGDEIRITVSVTGFALDGTKVGAGAAPGSGHYHVYLGDAQGEPLLVSAEGSAVVKVPADVTDGTHSLRVRLRNHDHSPLGPPVEATVRLIVYRL